ncbi:MAG TPA: ABC transporter permease subunit [Fimbriimonadaceae bacterium]|jgi:NitT/TauT family transport system permease protein
MARRFTFFRPILFKLPYGPADIAFLFGLFLLLYFTARVGSGLFVAFKPPTITPNVSLDPTNLPYYAARSLLRMFVGLFLSVIFTLCYGYACAKSPRAEKVLIPILDILQSVPVLGFLTVTITGFIALFRGSLLGLECASVFLVFTAQAWNMTFSFYHSLITIPRDLEEAGTIFRLSKWRRFTTIEIPSAMIGLVWNAMMSFGGGWFFVVVSEAFSIDKNNKYTLPGIGSYVSKALEAQDRAALWYALLTMVILIIIVDQLFWRPLVAWSEKFRIETSTSGDVSRSWMLNLIRASKIPRQVSRLTRRITNAIGKAMPQIRVNPGAIHVTDRFKRRATRRKYNEDLIYGILIGIVVIAGILKGFQFIDKEVPAHEVLVCIYLGSLTLARVLCIVVLATLVWTPLGVWIGFNPRLARGAQPIVLFLASFPANLIFPVITILFLRYHVSLNWGSIVLMALGTQWYILFNTIAGAMSVPTVLREMAKNMGVTGWQLWRKLIIPAIFPAWVTGAITASGGAWNASIVAEVVTWGNKTLVAKGLGSYITQYSDPRDVPRIVLGVTIMSFFVVGINRLFWRRLYAMAEVRFRLG